ncbi:hemerythrin domain-containing protein [Hydrogenophaga sp. T2]|uniref:hemerythrin domain-containing protein n=1 Tax=Hydrogenophaga sp. T2 TaxID=3132823 RepID=UPI003CEC3051
MNPHDTPIADSPSAKYASCHAGIAQRLQKLDEMPELVAAIARARSVAQRSLNAARDAIFEHHVEEERDLFSAVLASATPGAERMHVQAVIERLTAQHRAIEALWTSVERELVRGVTGCASRIELDDLRRLSAEYESHARFEEAVFLPMAENILERSGSGAAALALALHQRHAPEWPLHCAA